MSGLVLDFQEIDRTQGAVVGGKAAQLAELSRIEGVRVPPGFCVTTEAFQRVVSGVPAFEEALERLSRLGWEEAEAIRAVSAELRGIVEAMAIPDEVAAAITRSLGSLGEHSPYAVRSSATAEDLPRSSFAGQQDTYLNVTGPTAVLQHVSRCWASLFTERAVVYRRRNGFDERKVRMAVVVQQMALAQASGVMFTADPVTSNRKVLCVEACFGLGEALVSGRVNPDVYRVRGSEVVEKTLGIKELAVVVSPGGGTQELPIEPVRQGLPALSDRHVLELARVGRTVEAHFGHPQDIEWCLVDDGFQMVQSRPITTLFPIPAMDDGENHVYVSVGHAQMMTDAMRPLGISFWQLTAGRPMFHAGGRLFVDVARALGSPVTRAGYLDALGRSDPLTGDALREIVERGDFLPEVPENSADVPAGGSPTAPLDADPAVVEELIEGSEASVATLKADIRAVAGPALMDLVREDLQELRRILFDPRSHQAFMSAIDATRWLNETLQEWLGDKNVADTLTQSVPHNVTSEMGLALLDVADVVRRHPDVVELLRHADDEGFLDRMAALDGGPESQDAIRGFLDRYGMRCVGEIDITRTRWSERPATLVPVILGNVDTFEPGAGARRFEKGRQEAAAKERQVLERLRALPDGERKADETKRMIDRVRTFMGYREYPKYGMVSRYFVYKRALLEEAGRLVRAGVLREPEDIFYLTFQELDDVVRSHRVDDQLVRQRKEAFASYRTLTPPRVLTSDGEVVVGSYRRSDVPAGALVGLPVSAGTIEGRARVMHDMAEGELEPGDILVTAYTDPSWTPVFPVVAGLVTEVGGLMTHGAVIAREYGLPAVVGVEQATRLIRNGQRIRVHGADGFVEILD